MHVYLLWAKLLRHSSELARPVPGQTRSGYTTGVWVQDYCLGSTLSPSKREGRLIHIHTEWLQLTRCYQGMIMLVNYFR